MVKAQQNRISLTNKFRRDAWLEINLENLESNLKAIYESCKKPLMPVVKADAYGHGASIIAPILEAYDFVWGFGVAAIDEALALKELGIKKDILVLGVTPSWAFEAAVKNSIHITIVDIKSARELNELAAKLGLKANVHFKIDTGMNRIGLKAKEFSELLGELVSLNNLSIEYLFSHFADIADSKFSEEQLEKFKSMTEALPYKRHMASSFIARFLPESSFDMVRCGIELYGLAPLSDSQNKIDIKPLLSLFARVSYIKEVKKDETVSYSRTWKAQRDSLVATLPLGYADGLPRILSNKMKAFINGKEVKQIGTITMDQIMLDVTDLKGLKIGDCVELIGENLSLDSWAELAGTINYELATSLSLRLPKVYTRPEKRFETSANKEEVLKS